MKLKKVSNSALKQRNNSRAKKQPYYSNNNKNGGGEEEKMQKILDQAEGEGKMPCYIFALPQETLNHLFRGYLDPVDRLRSEPVSKRWLSTLRKEETWKGERTIDFATVTRGHPEIQRSQITDKHLVYLFSLIGQNLRELNIDSFVDKEGENNSVVSPNNKITEEILKSFHLIPNVNVLILPIIEINDRLFHKVARQLSSLKSLEYKFASNDSTTFEHWPPVAPGLQKLLRANSKLETLDFFGPSLKTIRCLPPTMKSFQMATFELNLPGALKTLATRCPTLETLNLWWIPNTIIEIQVNVSALNEAIARFKKLQSFHFIIQPDEIDFHGDEEFTALGELGGLRQIFLSHSRLISDATLRAIARGCPAQQAFIIRLASDAPAEDLGELSAEAFGSLSALRNLTLVDLVDQRALDDNALIRIAHGNRMLRCLKLKGSIKLTDASILAVLKNCKCLMELDVSGCPGVTEKSLKALVAKVRRLRHYSPLAIENGVLKPFCFACDRSGIPLEEAKKAAAELHPWLHIGTITDLI